MMYAIRRVYKNTADLLISVIVYTLVFYNEIYIQYYNDPSNISHAVCSVATYLVILNIDKAIIQALVYISAITFAQSVEV